MEKALGRGCEVLLAEFGAGISRCWKTNSHKSTVITQMRAYDSG
jgi:hypothetical protein